MSKTKKKKTNGFTIALMAASILSLVAISGSTYAWFWANRKNNGLQDNVQTDKGLVCEIYDFVGNFGAEGQVVGYDNNDYSGDSQLFNNYSKIIDDNNNGSLFIKHSNSNNSQILQVGDLNPGVRFTYLFKVSSKISVPSTINLTLTGFDAGQVKPEDGSVIYKPYVREHTDSSGNLIPERPIYISEAIDMMGLSLVSTTDIDTFNTNNLSTVKNFIIGTNETDVFTEISNKLSSPTVITFSNKIAHLEKGSDTANKYAYLFYTIEFSDAPSTFFISDGTNNEEQKTYFIKDPTGTSNVYQNSYFKITSLTISVED